MGKLLVRRLEKANNNPLLSWSSRLPPSAAMKDAALKKDIPPGPVRKSLHTTEKS